MIDNAKAKIILSAADEGIQHAVDHAPDGVDPLLIKVIAQMAALHASRRTIEKYDEMLDKKPE